VWIELVNGGLVTLKASDHVHVVTDSHSCGPGPYRAVLTSAGSVITLTGVGTALSINLADGPIDPPYDAARVILAGGDSGGPYAKFDNLSVVGPPGRGQPVVDPRSLGDGVTTTGTTHYPYQAGSLRVRVNGLDWTGSLTETSPSTGGYTLAYAPPLGATVERSYGGA
jgi:hypothetical protein